MLTTDLDNPGFSVQSGTVRSRGVELEGKVNVTQNLRVLAPVSRNQIKWQSTNDGREGRTVAMSPPLTASAWVNYELRHLHRSGGSRHGRGRPLRPTAATARTTSRIPFQIPSYTVYDAMVSYDLEKSPLRVKGVKVQANLENLKTRNTSPVQQHPRLLLRRRSYRDRGRDLQLVTHSVLRKTPAFAGVFFGLRLTVLLDLWRGSLLTRHRTPSGVKVSRQ